MLKQEQPVLQTSCCSNTFNPLITGGGLKLFTPSLMKSTTLQNVPVAKGIVGSALVGICKT